MLVAPSVGSVTSRRQVRSRGLSFTPYSATGSCCVEGDAQQLDDFGEPPAVVLSFDIDFKGDQGLTDSESVYDGRTSQPLRSIQSPNHVHKHRQVLRLRHQLQPNLLQVLGSDEPTVRGK